MLSSLKKKTVDRYKKKMLPGMVPLRSVIRPETKKITTFLILSFINRFAWKSLFFLQKTVEKLDSYVIVARESNNVARILRFRPTYSASGPSTFFFIARRNWCAVKDGTADQVLRPFTRAAKLNPVYYAALFSTCSFTIDTFRRTRGSEQEHIGEMTIGQGIQ